MTIRVISHYRLPHYVQKFAGRPVEFRKLGPTHYQLEGTTHVIDITAYSAADARRGLRRIVRARLQGVTT